MYNLITIQTLNDNNVARSMLAYETEEQAVGALYTTMASGVASETVNRVVCGILSDDGIFSRLENYSNQ